MILINFILCSALLLLVYRVLLAKEKMFRFNRVYLMFSLVFSMAVPFIPIATLPKTAVYKAEQYTNQQISEPVPNYPAKTETQTLQTQSITQHNYLPLIIGCIYGLVVLLFLSRFVINLYLIRLSIHAGESVPHGNVTLILTEKNIEPHSFLNYIFLNKNSYQNGLIEPQIICHEQAHASQLHTLDILFIELLQIFCWFNPAIPLYRNAIQLNHEFLADNVVIENKYDTPAYQLLLLTKTRTTNNLQLISQFNYQTTKKRLIMMTRSTNIKIATGKKLAIAPILVAATLLFSHKVMAIEEPVVNFNPNTKTIIADNKDTTKPTIKKPPVILRWPGINGPAAKQDAPQSVLDEYLSIEKKYKAYRSKEKPFQIGIPNITSEDDDRMRVLYRQMSKNQQNAQVFYYILNPLPTKIAITDKNLSDWKDAKTYGIWINNKRIKNSDLDQYNTSKLISTGISRLTPIAIKNDGFRYQLSLMTQEHYDAIVNEIKKKNKEGGYRMFNFNIINQSDKMLDQWTTDVKPEHTSR